MSSINEIIEYAAEAFSQTNINEARAELARLQAIAEAAKEMEERLTALRHYQMDVIAGDSTLEVENIYDHLDKAALAAYEKAIKS